ncbi:porin [Halomonas saccharevitans]|uniref:Outer membrane protein (Porin) n=1 Tax=Halomonas saccharevitans TaxID=416872 RepID=A0A1I6Y228_9GAMM|nr:porin [Halomonas saccharevitans]SFT44486.1 Outer membrane protein (porin) [Halomonas saccharevitans]
MKKTLLATAIAGALAASGAQAATVYNQDGTKLDLYGNLQIAYRTIERADANTGDVESKDDLFDNGSTLGVAGEHVIYDGLTGYFKYEFEGNADEAKTQGGLNSGDQAYFGLKGNFGDSRLGSWDPLIDDWIQDPITNNEYFDVSDSNSRIVGVEDSREGNKLQYMSPSFGGLQFALGTQYEGDFESNGSETVDGVGNSTLNVNQDDDSTASFFGGVKYTAGAFSIAAVYDNLGNNDGDYTGVDSDDNAISGDFDAGDQYGITAQYTVDTLRVAAKIERFESDNDFVADTNFYGVGARYGYGMGDIYGAYQYVDVGGGDFIDTADDALTSGDWPNEREDESYNEMMIGATYNISDAMYTFVEAAWYDREGDVDDGMAVGAVYLF